jgi:phage shock protein PspC (stress-responsive transcriptional regulator)
MKFDLGKVLVALAIVLFYTFGHWIAATILVAWFLISK